MTCLHEYSFEWNSSVCLFIYCWLHNKSLSIILWISKRDMEWRMNALDTSTAWNLMKFYNKNWVFQLIIKSRLCGIHSTSNNNKKSKHRRQTRIFYQWTKSDKTFRAYILIFSTYSSSWQLLFSRFFPRSYSIQSKNCRHRGTRNANHPAVAYRHPFCVYYWTIFLSF